MSFSSSAVGSRELPSKRTAADQRARALRDLEANLDRPLARRPRLHVALQSTGVIFTDAYPRRRYLSDIAATSASSTDFT